MNKYKNINNPEQLFKFMKENIKYGWVTNKRVVANDKNDMWKEYILLSPSEVLSYGIGTCTDQVEYQRDFFETHNYLFYTYFIQVKRQKDWPGHAFLIYKSGNKWYWFEHAWEAYQGIHEFNTKEEVLDYVTQSFIKHCSVLKCENNDFYLSSYDKLIPGINHSDIQKAVYNNMRNEINERKVVYN